MLHFHPSIGLQLVIWKGGGGGAKVLVPIIGCVDGRDVPEARATVCVRSKFQVSIIRET